MWIITTALADQFLGAVAEPGSLEKPASSGTPGDQHGALVVCGGQIARIVNYYDGPKTPRSLDGWPSLSDAVAGLHLALGRVAHAHGVELGAAVADKLRAITVRDSRRFARAEHDPSTAPCLELSAQQQRTRGTRRSGGAPVGRTGVVRAAARRERGRDRAHAQLVHARGVARASRRLRGQRSDARLGAVRGRVGAGGAERVVAQDPRRSAQAAASIDDRAAEPPLATRTPLTIAFNGVPLAAGVLSVPQPYILLQLGDIERTHDCRHSAR